MTSWTGTAVASDPAASSRTVATPENSIRISRPLRQESDDLTPQQKAVLRTMEIVSSAWFFVLGAAVGSFLNVVVYRLPAGIPLSRPKSRCSTCLTPIKLKDNIPILSWLRLKGRCRSCGARISPRYFFVEVVVGALFLALVWFETLSGGKTVPVREPNHYAGAVWILWYTKWDLIGLYLYHAFLTSVLTAMALIAWDGSPLPRRLVGLSLVVGLLFPVIWPDLHPVRFQVPAPEWLRAWRWDVEWQERWFSGGWRQSFGVGLDGALDGLLGTVAGSALGWLLSFGIPAEETREHRRDAVAATAIVGAFFGWQATFSVAILGAAIQLVVRVAELSVGRRMAGPIGVVSLAAAAVLQMFLWRALSEWTWWPGPFSATPTFFVAAMVTITAARMGRAIRRSLDLQDLPTSSQEPPHAVGLSAADAASAASGPGDVA